MIPLVPTRINWSDVRPGLRAAWQGETGDLLASVYAVVVASAALILGAQPTWVPLVTVGGGLLFLSWIIATGLRAARDARDFATYIDTQYPPNGLGVTTWTGEELDYLDGVRRLFGNQHGEADLP